MSEPFDVVVDGLIRPGRSARASAGVDVERWLRAPSAAGKRARRTASPPGVGAAGAEAAARLAGAFLVALAGPDHPLRQSARAVLEAPPDGAPAGLAELLNLGLRAVPLEIGRRAEADPAFGETLERAARTVAEWPDDKRELAEASWSVLFPEGVGLLGRSEAAARELRERRIVDQIAPNPRPIHDAAREVLYTSNVLLGLPLAESGPSEPVLDPAIAAAVAQARASTQRYWFDHPIPIGVASAESELLHGLAGLDRAVAAEPARSGSGETQVRRLACLLSVSVTHPELREVARRYVEIELSRVPSLSHVELFVASEADVSRLLDEVLRPAFARFGRTPADEPWPELDVLGVDGEYGRHYSFLKAASALWQVLFDPSVRATFKIDLDQVFPQAELAAETGRTALEHLETPLWGGRGRDAAGRPVELGMIAGTLVNATDIGSGLFTPDVRVPSGRLSASDRVFFSPLPQAISTEAEMTERYDGPRPDGVATALERIHITGGTNGILVDALRRHRPFTPSFIGRAEDQAYVISALGDEPRLAYVHAAGLVMRHDKEAYAGAAIDAARAGKMVGDDVRILVFSAYARAIADERAATGISLESIKALMDPFTGGFISLVPVATVLLRFALRILEAAEAGDLELARSYAAIGSRRLLENLALTADPAGFRARIDDERAQWDVFYDTLDGLESALAAGDPAALDLRERGRALIEGWRARTER